MTDEVKEWAALVEAAEKALAKTTTRNDVRDWWKERFGALGHRTLGRLLLGKTTAELVAKKEKAAE